ncbi:hypothetical protein NFI96_034207, partial [Prochilodus magdalenae]
ITQISQSPTWLKPKSCHRTSRGQKLLTFTKLESGYKKVVSKTRLKIELLASTPPAMCGGRKKMLPMTPKNTVPTVQAWRWKHNVLGVFLCQRVQGLLHTSKSLGRWDGAMYRTILRDNLLPSARDLKKWAVVGSFQHSPEPQSDRKSMEGAEGQSCQSDSPPNLHDLERICKEE